MTPISTPPSIILAKGTLKMIKLIYIGLAAVIATMWPALAFDLNDANKIANKARAADAALNFYNKCMATPNHDSQQCARANADALAAVPPALH